ncbi:protein STRICTOSIDINE SYNTHASE-LIKE 6-like [Iris pallida]|uniref:Protein STRICTOSIDINE SYNTHASE-LIKE 6-like n=1 Tax=Iris pallida TaxID=29817 RepID=A0AAX6EK95_IRIPA|nr:protein STRICTOSIDINE SYNTHASE-LIKE 6-like [Iris pallida]
MAKSAKTWLLLLLLLLATVVIPILISIVLYRLQPVGFDPVPLAGYSFGESVAVAERRLGIAASSERIGEGLLPGPEDLAYDGESGYLYTGCADGWVRRVRVAADEPEVEDWAHVVGGRPLGIALGPDKSLLVADAFKGLLIVKEDRSVSLLTDEAEGLKFAFTDGVDVASDGMIYFTDASYKFDLHTYLLDILGGHPYGRLMSFDASTNRTLVLARDLYFPNGVSLSPDQKSLIFCETVLRKCKRYHIQGDKKGKLETFIDNLPGFPDNIRYDGEGHYWIALSVGRTMVWDMLIKYPFLRKVMVAVGKYVRIPQTERDSGVLSVTPDGKPVALYSDPDLNLVTGGLKIGKHLYYGSLVKPYISRIDLAKIVADGE